MAIKSDPVVPVAYLSSEGGSAWNIAACMQIGLPLQPKETYRLKCEWDGKIYVWSVWRGKWFVIKRLPCKLPVVGGLKLQLGTNRGKGAEFAGSIDLNKSYICVGGKLWWEGVRGAYKKANK